MNETKSTLMGRALPATLKMLSAAGTSCVLSVTSEENVVTIALTKGKIAWATSNSTKRIGDVLVEKGFVNREVLGVVLSIQKRKRMRQPVCTILCELGLISPELAEAEIEARKALTSGLRRIGRYSWETASNLRTLATVIGAQGRHGEAEKLARAAIGTYR